MPSSTHTSSNQHANRPAHIAATNQRTTHSTYWYEPASNFGYGVGRLFRGAFDVALSAWQSWWNPNRALSAKEVVQLQQNIYVAGLKECVQQLGSALENVRKNPTELASLNRIDDLAQHYAAYVNFAPSMELQVYQQQLFKPIREQVERLADTRLKQKLKMLLPVVQIAFPLLPKDSAAQKTQQSMQGEEYGLALSQSYYDEAKTFKSPSNKKRYIEQTLTPIFPAVFNLSSLDGTNGFRVPAITPNGNLGESVNTAGDINGDNIPDLVLSAYAANSQNGTVYVIFGSRGGFGSVFNLSTLNGTNGFMVLGVASGGYLGRSVGTAGDINGDNITDLVLGAFNANSLDGAAYVIFGSRRGFSAIVDLTTLNGTNGVMIPGVASGGYLGVSVRTAGDMNGDNISDLVLGAQRANGNGAVYVIFGSREDFEPMLNLTNLNGSTGLTIPGVASGDRLGESASTAGDINGDNITDLVLGASGANLNDGIAYVIFGSRRGFESIFNLSTLNGTNGFTVSGGVVSGGTLGTSVNTAGDMNGDGISDLVLGAPLTNSLNGAGVAYVIFGSREDFEPILNLTTLNGTNGFTVPGIVSGGTLGNSVSTADDINGDGISDLLLGAPYSNLGKNGSAYVIFGSRGGFEAVFNLSTLNGTNGFTIPGIPPEEGLGISVSTAGDVNGDNITDLIVGAWTANSGNGSAYVIFGIAPTSTPTPPLTPTPTPTPTAISSLTVILDLLPNGTVILKSGQLPITDQGVISVQSIQGGYFTIVGDPLIRIQNFTYYQLKNEQVQLLPDGTGPFNITLGFNNALGQTVFFSPLVSAFQLNNSPSTSLPIGAILGISGAALATMSVGAAFFYRFKFWPQHTENLKADQRALDKIKIERHTLEKIAVMDKGGENRKPLI